LKPPTSAAVDDGCPKTGKVPELGAEVVVAAEDDGCPKTPKIPEPAAELVVATAGWPNMLTEDKAEVADDVV